jgi:hypothetical protein
MKHREYPTVLKQAALARLAAGESVSKVVWDLQLSTTPEQSTPANLSSFSCFTHGVEFSGGWLFLQRINSHRQLVFRGNPRPPMVRRSEEQRDDRVSWLFFAVLRRKTTTAKFHGRQVSPVSADTTISQKAIFVNSTTRR